MMESEEFFNRLRECVRLEILNVQQHGASSVSYDPTGERGPSAAAAMRWNSLAQDIKRLMLEN